MKEILDWFKTPKLHIYICWLAGQNEERQISWTKVSIILAAFISLVAYLY